MCYISIHTNPQRPTGARSNPLCRIIGWFSNSDERRLQHSPAKVLQVFHFAHFVLKACEACSRAPWARREEGPGCGAAALKWWCRGDRVVLVFGSPLCNTGAHVMFSHAPYWFMSLYCEFYIRLCFNKCSFFRPIKLNKLSIRLKSIINVLFGDSHFSSNERTILYLQVLLISLPLYFSVTTTNLTDE